MQSMRSNIGKQLSNAEEKLIRFLTSAETLERFEQPFMSQRERIIFNFTCTFAS